jgi:uncharacterized phage protein (TIGR02218 family)
MSYAGMDQSEQAAIPVLLFMFVQGASEWDLTSAPVDITGRVSKTWTAGVVVPEEFGQSGEMAKDALRLQLPLAHSLSQVFLLDPPDVVTTLTVYRTHYDDAESVVYWKGLVVDTQINGDVMTFECESIFSRLRRMGAAPTFTKTCRHVLFGIGCRLQAASFAETVTVTGVAGNGAILTVTEAAGHADMVGGTFAAPDGTIRMVIAHSGTTVTLMRRIRSLVADLAGSPGGFAATYYPGCNKSFETCRDTYSNEANFGGFPLMPDLNPMGGNNVF